MLKQLLRRMIPSGLRGWPPEDAEIVAVDVETTGLDPEVANVISIGAVPIRGRQVVLSDRFEATIKRDAPTHEGSVRIHRLRAMDLAHGVPPADALARFREWLGDRPMLGYCVDFDRKVLDRALRVGGLDPLDIVAYDLRRLHMLKRKRHDHDHDRHALLDFDAILADAGIPPLARHTAIGDAAATALAFIALRDGSG